METQVVDLVELKERVQGDQELLLELFEIFVEDYKSKRERLEKGLVTKDYEEVRNVAHSLKGSSGNISAKILREKVLIFEEMGAKNNVDNYEGVLMDLDEAYKNLLMRIDGIKKELS